MLGGREARPPLTVALHPCSMQGAYCWDADNNQYIDYGAPHCFQCMRQLDAWRGQLAALRRLYSLCCQDSAARRQSTPVRSFSCARGQRRSQETACWRAR